MIAGTAYGVVLNDAVERPALAQAFDAPPYVRPPEAPVVYIKPRTCFGFGGAAVPVQADGAELVLSPTIGLLFGRDCSSGDAPDVAIAAACLALDVSEPEADYYRPAIRQRCQDGFLPLGGFGGWSSDMASLVLTTTIDGALRHRWSLDRLVRPIGQLVRDLSAFMTLRAGDLLLVGLPVDAPRGRAGQMVTVAATSLPTLTTRLETVA